MRSNEQFKALVYAKAEKVSAENKKKRANMMRGIATLSLVALIGGVFLYSNNRNNTEKHLYDNGESYNVAKSEYRIYDAENFEAGVMPILLDDAVADDAAAVEAETYNYSFTECAAENFSYKVDVVYYSSENFEEQVQADRGNGAVDAASENEIVEIAKTLCTVEYNAYKVYFDNETSVWKINFHTEGTVGGDQSVYLDANGNVKMIIYGE